ncbi:MAG: hypothetical protein LBE75_06425 [Burkholderiales bacterium]|jgi:phage terminase Nu1 subunit (DNA packaging protein)|nr:hypothetical protein [Burkholderiales bacterium]
MADSVDVVARLLDLDPRRVQQLAKEGIIPRAKRGEYNAASCVRAYIHYLRARLDGEAGDQVAEKTLLVRAQRVKTEIESDRLLKKLVPAEDAVLAWSAMIGAARARLLIMPVRLAPICAGRPASEIEKTLAEEVNAALSDLKQWQPTEEQIDDDEQNSRTDQAGNGGMGATAGDEGRRMGG